MKTGKVTAQSLNIRKSPSSISAKTGKTLPLGKVVEIFETKNVGDTPWHRIGNAEWVSGKFISLLGEEKDIYLKPSDSMQVIQDALKKSGSIIHFGKGTYKITCNLHLYSNTTILLEKGAVLKQYGTSPMFMTHVSPDISYNYNAEKNIVIDGEGCLDGSGKGVTGTLISLIHASNITIKNIQIQRTHKSHAIDIGGSKGVLIQEVKFSKRTIDQDKPYKEEIQYDFMYASGIPYFPKDARIYNDNHCENITIKDCQFNDCNQCIGTHTETKTDRKHKNIRVLSNTAHGVGAVGGDGTFFKLINIDGAEVIGNNISGFARAIEITTGGKFYNTKGGYVPEKPANKTGCLNVTIKGNVIKSANSPYASPGIFINARLKNIWHDNILIENNEIDLLNAKAPSASFDVWAAQAKRITLSKNKTKLKVKKE